MRSSFKNVTAAFPFLSRDQKCLGRFFLSFFSESAYPARFWAIRLDTLLLLRKERISIYIFGCSKFTTASAVCSEPSELLNQTTCLNYPVSPQRSYTSSRGEWHQVYTVSAVRPILVQYDPRATPKTRLLNLDIPGLTVGVQGHL